MGGLLHLVREEGHGRAAAPPSPILAVPNVTSPLINGQCINDCIAILLCGFDVAIKGLSLRRSAMSSAESASFHPNAHVGLQISTVDMMNKTVLRERKPPPTPKFQPKVIRDSNPDCRINPDPDICWISPKTLWIHYLVGVSRFANLVS